MGVCNYTDGPIDAARLRELLHDKHSPVAMEVVRHSPGQCLQLHHGGGGGRPCDPLEGVELLRVYAHAAHVLARQCWPGRPERLLVARLEGRFFSVVAAGTNLATELWVERRLGERFLVMRAASGCEGRIVAAGRVVVALGRHQEELCEPM
jgi:hypothetical protein